MLYNIDLQSLKNVKQVISRLKPRSTLKIQNELYSKNLFYNLHQLHYPLTYYARVFISSQSLGDRRLTTLIYYLLLNLYTLI